MSRRANPTVIGGFVLGAMVLLVLGISYFGSGRLFSETVSYVLFFDGSLKGLNVGAPVLFRGVRVGTVTDIVVRYNAANSNVEIPVYVALEPGRFERIGDGLRKQDPAADVQGLIELGLRAQLIMQSFVTGMLTVELDFHPNSPVRLIGTEPRYPEMPTIPSPLEELARTLQNLPFDEMVADLRTTVQGINELVRSGELYSAIQSLDRSFQDLGKLIRRIDEKLDPISSSLLATSEEAREALKTIKEKISTLEKTLNETLVTYRQLAEGVHKQVEPVASSFRQTADSARSAFDQAKTTMSTAESVVAPQSVLHDRLVTALEEISAMARSIRALSDFLERNPEALLQGKNYPGDD
jgi:paraquat-inducible protein B